MIKTTLPGSLACLLLVSCEPGIVFNAPQPFNGTVCEEMPAQYVGDWLIDVNVMELPEGEREPTAADTILMDQPLLTITADTIFYNECRTDELHEDSLAGKNYELRNDHLFYKGEQISKRPVKKAGDTYYYFTRIDAIGFPVRPGDFESPGPAMPSFKTKVISGSNYFVFNLCAYDAPNRWSIFYFESTEKGGLSIRIAKPFDEINLTRLQKSARAIDIGKKYLVETATEQEFLAVVRSYFTELVVLKKKQ